MPFHQATHSFCTPQGGVRAVINAVGRMVQRGVLPSLRGLSLGGISWEAGKPVPRPGAAPHVETALLPPGRRPPRQLFWATDDVLPDLHVALGVREGYHLAHRVDDLGVIAARDPPGQLCDSGSAHQAQQGESFWVCCLS